MKKRFDDCRFIRLMGQIISVPCLALILTTHRVESVPIADGCDKFLGNICSGTPPSNFGDYWNQITLENEGKWANLEPSRDQYNWGPITAAYNYCQKNGIPYRHHTFLWNEQYPSWVNNLSAAEKKAEVEELIRAFGEKYPETAFIDVVNECREKSPSWKDALGGAGTTGYDWIVWAFEKCRQYCPKAKLALNEYYCEYSLEYVTEYLKIVKVLKEKNLIDGIGLQTHDGETKKGFQMGTLKKCLDSLATSGVALYSTEFDMSGTDAEQLKFYQDIFPVIWEHPAIKGVTLWGWTDSWLLHISNPKDARLMISGKERPALKWLKEYVPQHKQITRTNFKISIASSPRASFSCSPVAGNYRIALGHSEGGRTSLQLFDMLGRSAFSRQFDDIRAPVVFTIPENRVPRGRFIVKVKDVKGAQVRQVIPAR